MDTYFRLTPRRQAKLMEISSEAIWDTADARSGDLDFAAATKEAFRNYCAWHRRDARRQPALDNNDSVSSCYEILGLADVDDFAYDVRALLHIAVEKSVNQVATQSRKQAAKLAADGASVAAIRDREYDCILSWHVEGQHHATKRYLGMLEVWQLTPVIEEFREKGRRFHKQAVFYETLQKRLYDAGAEPHELMSDSLRRIAAQEDDEAQSS
jgi:hypothetical protein